MLHGIACAIRKKFSFSVQLALAGVHNFELLAGEEQQLQVVCF